MAQLVITSAERGAVLDSIHACTVFPTAPMASVSAALHAPAAITWLLEDDKSPKPAISALFIGDIFGNIHYL